ncbi:Fur family transcriptional regulator [Aliiroseovarius marinus]|uniref:Fur family transcriptional regulator n=1 Tax=Aliiroseovarius marinus TaxID=2500159 RepID=UPI003D7CC261
MTAQPGSAFGDHDHAKCTKTALDRAEQHCRDTGARLTPVRRRTLEILLHEHRAMGAYEVLEKLSSDGFGSQPPVAYRALEFLVDQGLAHRIRRLNAFAACTGPEQSHAPLFLICRSCKAVEELLADDVRAMVDAESQEIGFQVERTNLEALGLCPSCRTGSNA